MTTLTIYHENYSIYGDMCEEHDNGEYNVIKATFSPTSVKGKFSHEFYISLEIDGEEAGVQISINRNQARYLRSCLDAYLNEEEIDINNRDL